MKFVIPTAELSHLLARIQNVVPQKSPIPILSNILVEAANDELVLTVSDLTVGMRCFCEAKILEEGATTLPARRFTQLVRELTMPNLEVSSNASEVTHLVADTSHFKLHGMSKHEFPALPNLSGASYFTVQQSVLRDVLLRTAFAASREDNRHVLTGILMRVLKNQVIFVGTDGKRLARSYLAVDLEHPAVENYILPLKAVEEVAKNLKDDGNAKIFLMQDKVAVEVDNLTLITKLLSGEYPDVDQVIPQQSEINVSLHREELITLLRQVSLFTADTTHSARCSFSDGQLELSANSAEIGEGNVSMPVNYQGQKLEIAFNPGTFLDILRHCKGEVVNLGITDPYNPGVITESEGETVPPNPLFVIMPMRLINEE